MTVYALSVAGSDPSGGAGIQADLKSFSALGAYGMCVITALTAQSTQGVTGVFEVPVEVVRAQFDTLLEDITPTTTKIGMLGTAELARTVGEYVTALDTVVLDPVMVATSGDRLLEKDAIAQVRELSLKVDLITPNIDEAAVLLNCEPATSVDELVDQAKALITAGVKRALVKGGHLSSEATDVYADTSGVTLLSAEHINTANTHGTGCTLSSAIAALRPRHDSWLDTVREAKAYLTEAIRAADSLHVGHGHGPVHHFVRTWEGR